MASYFVSWEIDIEAKSPLEAARMAREIQNDPDAAAHCFTVWDGENGESTFVDLDELDNNIVEGG